MAKAAQWPTVVPDLVQMLGLGLAIDSGPQIDRRGSTLVVRYVVALTRGGAPFVRFPYNRHPLGRFHLTAADVLYDVVGDILHTQLARDIGDADWPLIAIRLPPDMVSEVAVALERAIGTGPYRMLLSAFSREEQQWFEMVFDQGFGSGRVQPRRKELTKLRDILRWLQQEDVTRE